MMGDEANRKVQTRTTKDTSRPAQASRVAVLSEWRAKSRGESAEAANVKGPRTIDQISRGEKQAVILQFILSGHPTDDQIDSVFRLVLTHNLSKP
jgi:hypothetical protein